MVRLKVIFCFLFIFRLIQDVCGQNFYAGLVCGLNAAQVDGDNYGGYNQPGLLAGISIMRKDPAKFNYGFELSYSMKGSHKKTTEDDPAPFQLRYTYICLPVFADLKELGPHLKRVHVRAGLSNNIKISSKVNFGNGWEQNTLRPYELSGVLGIKYLINKKAGFWIRHENSILSVGSPGSSAQFYKIGRNALRNRLVSFAFSYEL